MKDSVEKLYIEPTSACNLECSMCFRHNWIDEKAGMMNEEVFEKIISSINDIHSLTSVMFGGMGEPLLHKNIVDMVSCFAEKGIKTELLTNATMLGRNMSEKLINAGIDTLWISVDGFDREAYEKIHIGSRFDEITENIRFFNSIKGNAKTGATFVIMNENIDELIKLNRFADEMSFDIINLSYAVPCNPISRIDSCYDSGFKIGRQKRVDFSEYHERKLNYCPFVCENNCFIKWNGDVVPCMQLLHSSYSYIFEEKRQIMGKSFGNIEKRGLLDIWNSEEYTSFRELVKNFDFPDCTLCDGCDERLKNESDCMYNSFPTCGACLWAQGVGRCP